MFTATVGIPLLACYSHVGRGHSGFSKKGSIGFAAQQNNIGVDGSVWLVLQQVLATGRDPAGLLLNCGVFGETPGSL